MKILMVIGKINRSGASKVICWLANKLVNKYSKVSILTFMESKDSYYLCDNIERIKVCKNTSSRIYRVFNAIYVIHNLIIKEKYNIVITFLPLESLIGVLASWCTGAKVIVCERSDPYLEKTTVSVISRFFYRFANGAVFQSLEAREYFTDNLKKKSIVIENPVVKPQVPFIPYEERKNEIVSSGRLFIRQKRQDILLKAFAIVSAKNSNIKLKIIGNGPDRIQLEKLSKKLKIEDRVLFIENIDHVEDELKTAKLFVFTSDYEGMPNSILEALSMGVPVITTDYSPGGAKKLIEDKNRGIVVPRKDIDRLAYAIIELLSDDRKLKNMSETAKSICQEYSETIVYKKWINYIENISNELTREKN